MAAAVAVCPTPALTLTLLDLDLLVNRSSPVAVMACGTQT